MQAWTTLDELSEVEVLGLDNDGRICRKEKKERKSIYIAPFILCIVSKHSDMDHTVYLQITPCLPFLRKRSPDGATHN